MELKVGMYVNTPRFCTVRIKEVFESEWQAGQAGYVEPTYFANPEWGISGKSLDLYHMEFAAYRKY